MVHRHGVRFDRAEALAEFVELFGALTLAVKNENFVFEIGRVDVVPRRVQSGGEIDVRNLGDEGFADPRRRQALPVTP
jgi:hypothetical protein